MSETHTPLPSRFGLLTAISVICRKHGRVYLTDREYEEQLAMSDYPWHCPICGNKAEWNTHNFDDEKE